jgi:hypothetical protein
MTGFIYIWFDRKHKRYYIGSHWGSPDDGYICSSNWMRDAYRRRPQDFKRRILTTITTSRRDLLMEEQRWLYMIPEHQIGKRYYNIHLATHHWRSDQRLSGIVAEKIKHGLVGNKNHLGHKHSKTAREKMRKSHLGKCSRESEEKRIETRRRNGWNKRDLINRVYHI